MATSIKQPQMFAQFPYKLLDLTFIKHSPLPREAPYRGSTTYTVPVKSKLPVTSRFLQGETLVSRDETLVSRGETLVSRDETLVSRDEKAEKVWNIHK